MLISRGKIIKIKHYLINTYTKMNKEFTNFSLPKKAIPTQNIRKMFQA